MKDVIALDDNILFRRVAGEGVVVDQRRAEVMVVNEVGLRVLELLRDKVSVEDIVATVSDEFDAQPETVEADVLRFIDEITERGMTAA
jgi:hypothetical protein